MKTKNLIIVAILSVLSFVSSNVNAQKVAKVIITTKSSIADALEKSKEAGKKAKYGSRDYEVNANDGKVTLWQIVGRVNPFEIYCYVTAVKKDDITTLIFRLPHNPKAIANYTKELKKITKNLKLPEMMIGEYTDDIE